jgi:hypothetical protein
MTMTEPGMDLIHAPAQPALAPMSPDEAKRAMEIYREMCQSLLTADDMQRVGDRDFTKRSGFQKLAAAYGVSTEIKSLEVERDDGGNILRARAIVHATHPSGRFAEGDGACSSDEKRFRRGAEKIEHDLPATAVTRATNRAVSNLVAFGTVSAEEAEAGAPAARATPTWAAPMNDIPGVAHKLTQVLQAAGVDSPGAKAGQIGQEIFDLCDGTFPFALARLLHLIAGTTEPETVVEGDVDPADPREGVADEAPAAQDQNTTNEESTS